jgi:dUTP pyrophosphatase
MLKTINGGLLPQRVTKYSAGFDVFANEDVVIGAGETKLIGLGICIDQYSDIYFDMNPERLYVELHPRSSLRLKGLGGGVGIIDLDYQDEIKIVIQNIINNENCVDVRYHGEKGYKISKGDKIGQLILCRHEGWLLPSKYTKDEERIGGFGSTDV